MLIEGCMSALITNEKKKTDAGTDILSKMLQTASPFNLSDFTFVHFPVRTAGRQSYYSFVQACSGC